jgi:hypothetical protein
MESVIKSQGLAAVLDRLPEDDALAVVMMMALGSEEEKAKLAAAFAEQEKAGK